MTQIGTRDGAENMALDEAWRSIEGFEGVYEVSDHGRVRSLDRVVEQTNQHTSYSYVVAGKILKGGIYVHDGYAQHSIGLHWKGRRQPFLISRLVAHAFLGHRPEGRVVAHNDGNPLNNHVDNLRYATLSENYADRVKHGTDLRGEKAWNARLSAADVRRIRFLAGVVPGVELAARYGVSPMYICTIQKRRVWRHLDDNTANGAA